VRSAEPGQPDLWVGWAVPRTRGGYLAQVGADSIADSARERNRRVFDGAFGAIYGAYIRRERLARLIARFLWGSDTRPFYASMAAIGEVADGGTIVDVPCGAGVAFRALRPGQRVRYLGFDLSPRMLERARRQAGRLGLRQVELGEADAEALPLEDATADLFLSYFGLHCFPHPDCGARSWALPAPRRPTRGKHDRDRRATARSAPGAARRRRLRSRRKRGRPRALAVRCRRRRHRDRSARGPRSLQRQEDRALRRSRIRPPAPTPAA
jgi:SAM-dependent methyltransferase